MTVEEQLENWVNGVSLHNDDRDECCPDFSCCNPDMHTPKEDRELFVKAYRSGNEEVVHKMLIYFLFTSLR